MAANARPKRTTKNRNLFKPSFLERLPPEAKRSIWQKISPEHISKMLDTEEQDHQRSLIIICLALLCLLLVVLTVVLAPKNPELYKDIVQIIISFAGGGGLGYGLRGRRDNKQ